MSNFPVTTAGGGNAPSVTEEEVLWEDEIELIADEENDMNIGISSKTYDFTNFTSGLYYLEINGEKILAKGLMEEPGIVYFLYGTSGALIVVNDEDLNVMIGTEELEGVNTIKLIKPNASDLIGKNYVFYS